MTAEHTLDTINWLVGELSETRTLAARITCLEQQLLRKEAAIQDIRNGLKAEWHSIDNVSSCLYKNRGEPDKQKVMLKAENDLDGILDRLEQLRTIE